MIRSFLALSLPDDVADALIDLQDNVRNARWVDAENFHITLVFLGNCTTRQLADLDTGLAALRMERFEVELAGTGAFGGAKPRLLYADIAENESLRRLQSKTERMAREVGIEVESRKFVPHVTLARCGGGVIPSQAVEWAAKNNRFRLDPFTVHGFGLYRSDLGGGAPVYSELMHYPLGLPGSDPQTPPPAS